MSKPLEKYTMRELRLEIVKLREIALSAVCKKGCGEVELEFEGYLGCSSCGEEMEGQITSAQFKYAEKFLK